MRGTALSSLALPLVALATSPILARALGPVGRGELAAVVTPLSLAVVIFTFGTSEAATYFAARSRSGLDVEHHVRTALAAATISGILGFAVLVVVAPIFLARYPAQVSLLTLLAATLPVALATGAARGAHLGLGNTRLVYTERWLSPVLRLALILVLVAADSLTVFTAALSTWGTGLLSGLLLFWGLPYKGGWPRLSQLTTFLPFSLRTWSGSLSGFLVLRLDQALLVLLVTPPQLAFYAIAVAVAEVPQTMIGALRQLLLAEAAGARDVSLIARSCRLVAICGAAMAVVTACVAPWAVPLVFGDDFQPAVLMIQILAVAAIPAGLTSVINAGLVALGLPGRQVVNQIAALVPSLIALPPLALWIGGNGAAVASLLSYAAGLAVALVQLRRAAGVRPVTCLVPRVADAKTLAKLIR
nr:oligosaccharide flippase family protein [Blastococcus sp. CCUG 61487]